MWLFLLYGIVAVLALKSLFRLMEQHKEYHVFMLKVERKRQAEAQAEEDAAAALEKQLDQAEDKLESAA